MMEALKITAADGHRFTLSLFPAQPAAPVLLIGPAMGTPARVYTPLAEAFAAQGLNAVVLELRGIGSSSLRAARGVDFGYHTLTQQDWFAARAAVRARLPQAPMVLFGHSLGGQVSLLSAASQPADVAAAVIVAAGSVYHRGWSGARRLGILVFTQFAGALAGLFGYFPGKRVGFGGTEARTIMQDWARLGRSGRFDLAGGVDYETALARCTVPVLGLSFQYDSFAPHRAQQLLLDKLSAARVEHQALSAEDTGERLDHYNWIRKNAGVVARVTQWLKTHGVAP